jgi:hypothetical protein
MRIGFGCARTCMRPWGSPVCRPVLDFWCCERTELARTSCVTRRDVVDVGGEARRR